MVITKSEVPTGRKEKDMKGSLVGTHQMGEILQLWYSSPTGDESDSQIHNINCKSVQEAQDLEDEHRRRWELEPLVRVEEESKTAELCGQVYATDW